jgi:putative hemolysin
LEPSSINTLLFQKLLLSATPNTTFYVVGGLVLIILILLSALVSGAEVAFFSLSHSDRMKCKTSSVEADVKIFQLLENPQRLLATILLLNNLFNVAFVTFSTYLTWQVFGKEIDWKIKAVLVCIETFLIVFVGEVTPKVYSNVRSLEVARNTVGIIAFAVKYLKPFSSGLLTISHVVEKRFQRKNYTLSVDEMNKAIEITTNQEESSEEEKGILKGIVKFGTISAKQIMTVRPDISGIEIDTKFSDLIKMISKSEYSRIPIYKDTLDKIEGILHAKDVLPYIHLEDFDWLTLIKKEVFFIPENKKIDVLLKDFQEMRVHIAIVADEYGGTSGLVTLEDVLEEIVGEINDEFDDEQSRPYEQINENTYIFEGKISLNDFCKELDIEESIFEEVKGDSESLAGLILELNQGMPNVSQTIIYQNFVFEITSADKRKIKKIKVEHKLTNNQVLDEKTGL